jgi:hypothetical protein
MKAHYGTTPIPIPQTYTSPQQIGKLSREVQQSIKALRDRAVIAHGGARTNASSMQQFKVRLIKDGETWKAIVKSGWVITSNPATTADPVIEYSVPTMGGVALDAEETPKLTVTAGQTVYIKLSVTNKGIFSSAEIVADTPTKASTHNQPPTASIAGVMYYKLADVVEDEDSEAGPPPLKISKQYHLGPFYDKPNLPELENVGGGAGEVFKERDTSADKYLLRTIKSVADAGKPILKPLPDPLAVSHIPLRGIKDIGVSTAQIKVTAADADDDILIRGNSYEADLTGIVGQIAVRDGLVISASLASAVSGWWGTLSISLKNKGASAQDLAFTFENGILKTVLLNQADVSGVQGTPGTASIAMEDTWPPEV